MSSIDHPQSMIEIKASHLWISWVFVFFKPKASINGSEPFPISWGITPVPVTPGRYQVDVWLPYLFYRFMGKNGAIVEVPAGGAVRVSWRAPWIVFIQGKVEVAGPWPLAESAHGPQMSAGAAAWTGGAQAAQPTVVAAAAPSAGAWHPDPTGRHQHRWYDGSAWTDQVADNGANSTDPIGG